MDITYQSIALVLKRIEDSFGQAALSNISVTGIPRDMQSAVALANKKDDRLRKEFEKWAVLTYTKNRARINEKKGADSGIDGTALFRSGTTNNKIIFQVKSGKVRRSDVATLRGDMLRESAELGVLITLEEPSEPMRKESRAAGHYNHEEMNKNYDRIEIVTIKEMIEGGKRLEIPMPVDVLKVAPSKKQHILF